MPPNLSSENANATSTLSKSVIKRKNKTYINVRYLNEVVILAVDPATKSGWCIWSPDGYHSYGEANVYSESGRIESIVNEALALATEKNLPLFVVAEKWTSHGLGNQAYAGLCATWGIWKWAIDRAGIKKKNVVRVFPQTWRTWTLGRGGLRREQLKMISINVASRLVGETVDSDNTADAINIARWAQYCWNVGGKGPSPSGKTILPTR
jgi:hypothetical protein